MTTVNSLYSRMIKAMGIDNLEIPFTAVKIYRGNDVISDLVRQYEPDDISVTSCQANKQASIGDVLLLTRDNIGCIAAAITFGLVDDKQDYALKGSRVYTDIMKEQSELDERFAPPTPKDFTDGLVYACRDADKPEYCLFGDKDSGRFKSVEIAAKAVSEMIAIKPADTKGVFFYSKDFDDDDVIPDVVTMDVRPVELTRIVQAYQFMTGERVIGNMGPVRVVNSDLIVRPYLTGEINFSSYCVGARLIAKYDPNRLGIGIPFKKFKLLVQGMEESMHGYPFYNYPGAKSN